MGQNLIDRIIPTTYPFLIQLRHLFKKKFLIDKSYIKDLLIFYPV